MQIEATGVPLGCLTPLGGLGVRRQAAMGDSEELEAWKSWMSAAEEGFWGSSMR